MASEIDRLMARGFTRHQALVILELLEGYKNKEIAQRLGVAEVTVKFHLGKAYAISKSRGREDLRKKLTRWGF